MARRFAAVAIAYLVSLLIVAAAFAVPNAYMAMTTEPVEDDMFNLTPIGVALLVYAMAFVTTLIPFAIMRGLAGKYDLLGYKTAVVLGAILGIVAYMMMSFTGASLGGAPWLFAIFAALGAITAAAYWWLEQSLRDRFVTRQSKNQQRSNA